MNEPRLNEYDLEEWFDVCKAVQPALTRERFVVLWDEFQEMKAAEERRRRLN